MPPPTVFDLKAFEGKSISSICGTGFTNNAHNHCAHFVGHALGYAFGFTCKQMTGKGTVTASIRVHELFAKCPLVGEWDDRTARSCLAFVTDASNVNLATKTMKNVPRKHIGIFIDDTIWHYSNTRDLVVTQTPKAFAKHYSGDNIAVFFGTFPL